MKNKKGLFVHTDKYKEVIKLLKKADIRYTSMLGIFHFDLISAIIGFALGLSLGIVIF